MLVALSSSQGAGKTTILKSLKDLGFHIIERKTSRSILNEWGIPLEEINRDPSLTIKFQEEIIKRKYEDDISQHDQMSDQIIFTERTFADLFAYTMAAIGSQNTYSEWINNYYEQCMLYQQCYDKVFYLKAGHFNVQPDAVRSTNHHFSRMMDLVMKEYTIQMSGPTVEIIDTPMLDERVRIILYRTLTAAGWSVEEIRDFVAQKLSQTIQTPK